VTSSLPPRVLVLGIGNLLMGDEGAGIHAVQALQRESLPAGVDVLDGGTGGFNLLAPFREYPCVILIDATLDGRAPGTVETLQPRFLDEYPRSLAAHDIGLHDLIETAALLGPLPRIHLVAISIAQVDSATIELTPPVRAAIPTVLRSVWQILGVEGFAFAGINRR
jgi:hydrogenase maturation protease